MIPRVARDDLVSKFSRSMPERVAQATELWLEYEQGKAESLATLRRLLHTIKGESHMLDLDNCGELAERAEALVDVLLRVGQATALTGDALLGSLEGMAVLAADPHAQEAPELGGLYEQLEAAAEELRANATTASSRTEAVGVQKPELERETAVQKAGASTDDVELLRSLIREIRALHAERAAFHESLRDAQNTLRALLVEIDPHRSLDDLAERVTRMLESGSEVDQRLSKIGADWSGNELAAGLRLGELEDALRKASVVGTDRHPRAARLPRALVVEDAPVARELLSGILRSLGLSVEEATDGRQGIAMAKSNPPDVLLTDVEMPHMDGVDMVRELKAVAELARVPVIVLTTTAGNTNRERLEELGVTAILPKQELTEERLRRLIEFVLPEQR